MPFSILARAQQARGLQRAPDKYLVGDATDLVIRIREIRAAQPDATIFVVGKGDDTEELQALAQSVCAGGYSVEPAAGSVFPKAPEWRRADSHRD